MKELLLGNHIYVCSTYDIHVNYKQAMSKQMNCGGGSIHA